MPDDKDAPPTAAEYLPELPAEEAPVGFWADLVAAVRQELRPPMSGFFTTTPNAPVSGSLRGDTLVLKCANKFTLEMIDRQDIRDLVRRKASAILGRPVVVRPEDGTQRPASNPAMERLLRFGRDHSDIVNIKNT